MYNKLIIKNFNHFGPDGLIMYAKSCDYYNINQVTIEDIKMYYDLLRSNEPLPNYIRKLPHISCCLYFLAKNNPSYEKTFTINLISKLNNKDEVNDTNLFLIYNIIEFNERYLHSTGNRLQFLLSYLEKFNNLKKTVENYLLFKYYRGLIKYHLGEISEAYNEYLEIIIGYEDYVTKKTNYSEFIRLKNNLLKVQLDLTKHIKEEYYEQYCFMKELYDKIKLQNKALGVKLGFCLYEILCRQNKFHECIPLLKEMKKTLKNEALSGAKMKISIDYNLAIINRLGFISVLIGDRQSTEYSIKKINKVLEIIEKDKQDKKLSLIYKAYTFIVSILNVHLGNYENRLKEKEAIFREEFFTDNLDIKKSSYLVNNSNKDDLIINLNAINNMNYNLSNYASEIIKTLEKAIGPNVNNNILLGNHFITFIVGKYDIINRLSESYCTDKNASKRVDYIKQINNHWKMVYSYIKKIVDDEPLLEADFIKSLLINMFSTAAHSNLYCKDLDMLKTNIKIFDDLIKELNIKDKNTSFELVNKVKGDYWFKKGDYDAAISYYKETINKMKDNDPKKPVVFFNIGCASYLTNNKNDAIKYLNQCINAFRVFEYEKKTFNILVRIDVISRKFNTAKYLLKVLGE